MKKADLFEVILKVFGLYLGYQAVQFLADFIMNLLIVLERNDPDGQPGVPSLILVGTVNFAIIVGFGILFFFGARRLTKMICKPSENETSISIQNDRKSLFEIAFVIIGGVIFVWTIPVFLTQLYYYAITIWSFDMPPDPAYEKNLFITSSLKIIFSLLFFFKAEMMANYLVRKKSEENESE